MFARARLPIDGQVRLLFGVESERGEKLSIDAEHSFARKEMVEARELLQVSQIGLCRVIDETPASRGEQIRKRVYVAAFGLRQNAPRPRGCPLVIKSAQLPEHRKAIFIAQFSRAVAQLSSRSARKSWTAPITPARRANRSRRRAKSFSSASSEADARKGLSPPCQSTSASAS